MKEYNHKAIESKWRERWEEEGIYKVGSPSTRDGKGSPSTGSGRKGRKCYVLDMFPYPSGEGLHVGHPKGYIATDVYSRMKKMQGHKILHPMGWDAFGLPAENYAIKNKVHPRVAVQKNIKRFKEQLSLLGFNYDWSREINTTDPEYYKWTQWIFLQMFKKGLAYQSYEPINWCPSCQTGLANEDLDGGACERCGTIVEKKPMRQWVLKITDYAERLLEGLSDLDWPESIKESQRNWIGKSEGSLIRFSILWKSDFHSGKSDFPDIEVFTTRPDTLFGATYLVLSPEHSEITNHKSQITNWVEVEKYIKKAKAKTEQDRVAEGKDSPSRKASAEQGKTGVELKGIKAVNPANKEEISVWVADYVLGSYGTGAIMAVPAHDERDFEFAKKYGLPIIMVVCPNYPQKICPVLDEAYLGEGHLVGSGKFDGMESEKAKWEITKFVKGKRVTKYKLRDWVFSRQRYWGEPIPIIYCRKCWEILNPKSEILNKSKIQNSKLRENIDYAFLDGEHCVIHPVPEEELPVKLPEVKAYAPTGTGESPLANIKEWVNTKCPKCGGKAKRETNTMPQWAGSSWYYIAYVIGENSKFQIPNSKLTDYWLPVDMYVGGAEHATRHLIYARFWHKFLYDIKVVSTDEPFSRLQHVGLIGGADGRKMSKRYGNVINPDDVVAKFGADTLRLYEMFMGPFDANIPWSEDGILGPRRFLERVWRLGISNFQFPISNENSKSEKALEKLLHKTIKKVTEDIEGFRFNTAISALMILFNEVEKKTQDLGPRIEEKTLETFLKLLAPFAPHVTEELWQERRQTRTDTRTNADKGRRTSALSQRKSAFGSIHLEPWPTFDAKLAEEDVFQLVVQVNGKTRATIEVEKGISQAGAEKLARGDERTSRHLEGKKVKKAVFVRDRLINFVTG